MRVWLASVGERPPTSTNPPERPGRMALLAEAIEAAGGQVTWWSTTFDHARKKHVTPQGARYNVRPTHEVILTGAPGYARNISVQRLAFNFRTAREFAIRAEQHERPDIILTSYPPIELVSRIGAYGRKHSVPTLADIRDLWPDIWLEASPRFAQPLAKVALSPYFALSRSSLGGVSAITAITEEFVSWGLRRAGRTAREFDRAFPFGYRIPEFDSETIQEARRFWDEMLAPLPPSGLRLCLIGKMGERTGHDHVIAAVRSLPAEAKNRVQLVICGTDMRQATAKYGTDPAIKFAGWVDQSKIVELMRRSDLGVLPYRNSYDYQNSLSNKTIEYLAGGMALTTGLEGKVRQLILERDCGYVYPDQDADAYRELIRKILADGDSLRQRKQAALQVYKERFRAEAVYSEFAAYLESVVRSHKP